MFHYPKIKSSQHAQLGQCIAFEKYDGTNLHWTWDSKSGWTSFGTRRDDFALDELGRLEFIERHPELGEACDVFDANFALQLTPLLEQLFAQTTAAITLFTEFLGEKSFAGRHKEGDEKRLVLFDVRVGEEMMSPFEFAAQFASVDSARVIFRGKFSGKLTEDVRQGKYDVTEGVVVKGVSKGELWMAKIKTNQYMSNLKQAFEDRWEDYWE